MHIERADPATLSPEVAEQMARITQEAWAISRPGATPPSAEGLRLRAKHDHDDVPRAAMWLARDDAGRLVGHAFLDISLWDNPQLAFFDCEVAPAAQGQGIGTALLETQTSLAKELGRSSLASYAIAGSAAASLLAANGYQPAMQQALRRLDVADLDYGHIASLATDAADRATDYELVRIDGPPPDDMLPSLTALFESINDAPTDDLEVEPDQFPVERLQRYGLAMEHRGQRVYRLLARHRPSGSWAGHTILCVDTTRPGFAMQEDTTVLGAHRGHRLGMWLKTAMLLWMRDAHPELTAIDTWNAASNSHMIAINDALGCRVAELGVAMQRSL